MIELRTTRYYGKMYLREDKGFHFVVKLIAPPASRPTQYIGRRGQKLSDLLCIDDAIIAGIPDLSIDWSEVRSV